MTAPAAFKQNDLTRALKGVRASGMSPSRVRIAPDGAIDIIFGEAESLEEINPLDAKYGTKS